MFTPNALQERWGHTTSWFQICRRCVLLRQPFITQHANQKRNTVKTTPPALNHPRRCALALAAFLCLAPCGTTLGAQNTNAELSLVQEVLHTLRQPRSNQAVTITARLGSPVKSVALEYQVIDPGSYLSLEDTEYKTRWVSVSMTNTTSSAEIRYASEIPGSIQTHRRLVRYRFKTTDAQGRNASTPPRDDPEPRLITIRT